MERETVDVTFLKNCFEMTDAVETVSSVHTTITTVADSSKRHFEVDDLHGAIILDKGT